MERAGRAGEWGWAWRAPGSDGPGLVSEAAWMLQDSADLSLLFFYFFILDFFFFTKELSVSNNEMIFLPVLNSQLLVIFSQSAKVCLPRGPPAPLEFRSVQLSVCERVWGLARASQRGDLSRHRSSCEGFALPEAPVGLRQFNVFIFDGT